MSSGTHSNMQSNSPPPRRGRRITRSREPTSELHATSSEVPSILTGLLGSSPPRSRPESSPSSDQGDFWHPGIPTTRDHLTAVYNDETGDIPIGFDITHLLSRSRLLPAYSEDSGDTPNGFDPTHLLSRSRLIPAYSAESGDIPVAWILFNPLAGTAAFRPREGEARHRPNPYVSIEEFENELREYPGTFQEWQKNRAEDFYRDHRQRHQERLDEWRVERVRRASNHSPLRGLEDPSSSRRASSDAEAQPRTTTEDASQSNELSEANRQHLINWLRSRAQQRRAAREAQEAAEPAHFSTLVTSFPQEAADHDFAVDLAAESSDHSSMNAQPSARDEAHPTPSHTHPPPASTQAEASTSTSISAQPSTSTTPAAPFILPPEPEPHFLTSLNSYRYHLGTILLQPIPEEEFDEDEMRQMIIDANIHDRLRVLAYGRRQN